MTGQFHFDITKVPECQLHVSCRQDWRRNMKKTKAVAKWALYAYVTQAIAGLVIGFVMGLRITLGM